VRGRWRFNQRAVDLAVGIEGGRKGVVELVEVNVGVVLVTGVHKNLQAGEDKKHKEKGEGTREGAGV
jgi:hypothetical protein